YARCLIVTHTHNAALRCEQRYHETQLDHRKHKTQRWNEKCQALGITLKCFVRYFIAADVE
ncbi:hypothetical protein K6U15_15860, partial [Vibrio parahaemolyticus]|nr:hypothetical protein [Vibrio parahaemolyticus]